MSVEVVTVPRVPILRTGQYQLQTGPANFTMDHLTAAVEAFNNDPAVLAPRIRVQQPEVDGHDVEAISQEAAGLPGAPALGWADELTVDGNTLYADLHVPAELADVMEWAFPSRSIEGAFGVQTATGHTHEFMATGLLLLGHDWPGVTTLPDVRELEREFAENVAAGEASGSYVGATGAAAEPVAASRVVARVGASAGRRGREVLVGAGIAVTDLPRRWYAAEGAGELEGLPDSYDFWAWYVTEVRVDDDGNLYVLAYDENAAREWRFDVTISGADTTFAEPYEVMRPEPVRVAAGQDRRPHLALASWHSRDTSRAVSASSPTHPDQEDDSPMTDEQRRALAASLGLNPDEATEADVHAAAAERAANPPEPETPPEGSGPEAEVTPEAEGAEPEPAGVAARTTTISRERLAELERNAAEGAAARAEQIASQRTAAVQAAVADGRITPAEAGLTPNSDGTWPAGWRADLDESPVVTARALDRLEKGRYPGTAARSGVTPQEGAAQAAASLARARRASGLPTTEKVG